jgi:integrase/recombinase XerD
MARSRSYAERVNVLKKVLVDGTWKFVRVLQRKGRIVRDHVVVAGQDQHHPESSYYIEWYEGSRRRKQCVGSFEDVLTAARRKSIERNALKEGIAMVDVADGPGPSAGIPPHSNGRLTKDAALNEYLTYIKANRSPGTYKAYRYTLDVLLRSSFSKTYIDELAHDDIEKFTAFCAERGYEGRTIYDKLVVVLQFFKRNGKTHLITPSDWPKYVETIRYGAPFSSPLPSSVKLPRQARARIVDKRRARLVSLQSN